MTAKFVIKCFIGVLLLMPFTLRAQTSQGSSGSQPATSKIHVVQKGETLSSIARQNNCTPDELRKLNPSVDFDKLLYDSKIKVPTAGSAVTEIKPAHSGSTVVKTLTGTSVSSDGKGASGFSLDTHIVQKGETLSLIAAQYNQKVSDLRQWNHLTGDNIIVGKKLIVGKEPVMLDVKVNTTKKTVAPKAAVAVNSKEIIKPVVVPIIVKQTDLVETMQKGNAIWEKGTTSPDGLLYGICSGFPVGSIVKITNLENNQNVIVKITGELPADEQGNDVVIKIPETAARQLNASAETFAVQVSSFVPPVLSSK